MALTMPTRELNVINPETGAPDWFGADEDVWKEWEQQLK